MGRRVGLTGGRAIRGRPQGSNPHIHVHSALSMTTDRPHKGPGDHCKGSAFERNHNRHNRHFCHFCHFVANLITKLTTSGKTFVVSHRGGHLNRGLRRSLFAKRSPRLRPLAPFAGATTCHAHTDQKCSDVLCGCQGTGRRGGGEGNDFINYDILTSYRIV